MGIRFSRFPDAAKFKKYHAFGLGIIISNDVFRGVSIVLGFWQVNIGNV